MDGVGVGKVSSKLGKAIDIWLGGALGWGLGYVISDAYHYLCQNYEPGDEVFVFGFSRGAWAARSLIGLVRKCGILVPSNFHQIADVVDFYWNKSAFADSEEAFLQRQIWSPEVVTSELEKDYRQRKGAQDSSVFKVKFLGLWDTVGALGVPRHPLLPYTWFDNKARLHDIDKSPLVGALRHAAAIDEKRSFYPFSSIKIPHASNTTRDPRSDLFLEQWFPGDHGSVGGGSELTGLSNITLRWVLEGAIHQGLSVDSHALAAVVEDEDYGAPLSSRSRAVGLYRRAENFFSTDRIGPSSIGQVSEAARSRWREFNYRPASLLHLKELLDEEIIFDSLN